MEDKCFRKGYQKLIYTESMRELGYSRFVLGGVILLFGLFFIWIEIYLVGILISAFAIILMEHCSETIIDKGNMVLIKKTGWIKPFLTLKKKSIEGVVSLSIQTVKTRRRTPGRVAGNTSISYKLNFEMPGKKIHINTFTEKTRANSFANEVAQLLEIESVKPKAKQKSSKDD